MGIGRWHQYELSNLSGDDVQALKKAYREVLDYCASTSEDVKENALRKEAAGFIAPTQMQVAAFSCGKYACFPLYFEKIINSILFKTEDALRLTDILSRYTNH